MSNNELEDAKARGLIFEYLQLKAKIDHISAEQDILKAQLEQVMLQMGCDLIEGTDGKAQVIKKNKYSFDIPKIIVVVPGITSKLKLSNEEYNKVLVGNEVALLGCRQVIGTDRSLTISAIKPKAK